SERYNRKPKGERAFRFVYHRAKRNHRHDQGDGDWQHKLLGIGVAVGGRSYRREQGSIKEISAQEIKDECDENCAQWQRVDLFENEFEILSRLRPLRRNRLDLFLALLKLIYGKVILGKLNNAHRKRHPQYELRQSDQRDADNLAHHQLEGPHRRDDDFHNPVCLLFNHASHHLRAKQEYEKVNKQRPDIAHRRGDFGAAALLAGFRHYRGADGYVSFQLVYLVAAQARPVQLDVFKLFIDRSPDVVFHL